MRKNLFYLLLLMGLGPTAFAASSDQEWPPKLQGNLELQITNNTSNDFCYYQTNATFQGKITYNNDKCKACPHYCLPKNTVSKILISPSVGQANNLQLRMYTDGGKNSFDFVYGQPESTCSNYYSRSENPINFCVTPTNMKSCCTISTSSPKSWDGQDNTVFLIQLDPK